MSWDKWGERSGVRSWLMVKGEGKWEWKSDLTGYAAGKERLIPGNPVHRGEVMAGMAWKRGNPGGIAAADVPLCYPFHQGILPGEDYVPLCRQVTAKYLELILFYYVIIYGRKPWFQSAFFDNLVYAVKRAAYLYHN